MTTVAQAGILGFGPSAGKGIAVASGNWYRHKAVNIDFGVQDDQRLGPPEVGGRPLPTIPFKAGVAVGGGFTVHPRLESSLGWLLYGAFGYVETTSGSGGVKNHAFKLDPVNPGYVPFMGFRKYIPHDGQAGNYGLGETYNDCKITGLMLTLPNDGLISARVEGVGRTFALEQSPNWGISSGSTGGWNATTGEFEDYGSIPIGSTPGGYIYTPDFGFLPVVQAVVGIGNQNLDPRMERVYGSPFLEDVTIVSRQVSIELTVKWTNPALYRQILTGSISGTEWSSVPFTTAIDFRSVSPANMPSEAQPYEAFLEVEEAMLAMQGSIVLAGNDAVMMRFRGTALDVGADYASVTLRNKHTAYTWPT